ncbi:MAG TPA: hypothetical protein VI603_03515 [Saprospiraceae bacterium]|nr:hypothetical protein [Saprospiraceae bacterium]
MKQRVCQPAIGMETCARLHRLALWLEPANASAEYCEWGYIGAQSEGRRSREYGLNGAERWYGIRQNTDSMG